MERSTIIKVVAIAVVLTGAFAYALFSFNAAAGSPLVWEAGAADPVRQFYPSGGEALLVTEGNVSLINASGTCAWSVGLQAPLYSSPDGAGGLYVYLSNHDLWHVSPDGRSELVGVYLLDSPLVAGSNGTLYLLSGTNLSAFSPEGVLCWTDSCAISDPVVDESGYVYYLARDTALPMDVYLRSRSANGSLRWSSLIDNYDGSTVIVPHESGLYVSRSSAGELYRILDDGTVMWKYYKPYLGHYLLRSDDGGQLFLIYDLGTVHVLNDEGDVIGKYSLELADASVIEQSATSSGILYAAVRDGSSASVGVVAVDHAGTPLWTVALNSTRPVRLSATNGSVCVATEVNRIGRVIPVIYFLDGGGDLLYTYSAANPESWDSVRIAGDFLYALTKGGRLYVLKLPVS